MTAAGNLVRMTRKEAFNPTTFFLFLLPPIMYESAYNLHKGNFFRNIGSILVFAIVGTALSAFVVGVSLFFLGQKKWVYQLTFAESLAFGSFLSSVDPVATVAVFQALDVEPVLKMLVIGESILNDAVAIVLSTSVWEAKLKDTSDDVTMSSIILQCTLTFVTVFFSSAIVGVSFGLVAALLFKHVELRRYASLEFGMMMILIYAPYCVAEVLQLSGIIAILFNGLVMSHYTHFNLSRLVQQIIQVTLRSISFIAETCVFAYLGVSIFSFQLDIEIRFIIASIFLCMLGRALTVFPLSLCVNLCRDHKITFEMMFIMWFSAIRGAVSYALSLRFEFEENKRNVIVTATLIIVLFTTLVFGGSTMPLLKCLQRREAKKRSEICQSEVCLIKTEALVNDAKSNISEQFFKDWYTMVKSDESP
ncbi:sodium/hydrogen exchanger 8-like [Uloborus diversus]|uniref:sodium/hydrogen exchanger 8-like n=1 Tax=Uloborus diversus TaxID=327109 RepID=UPI0024096256|nr:sodium/hydrogen exchanger 8-like [Uloborus diversus]